MMTRSGAINATLPICTVLTVLLLAALGLHLGWGLKDLGAAKIVRTVLYAQEDTYDQAVLLHQHLPRALIALYAGGMLAVGGIVLQGLVRNPLASPGSLGLNAGAALAVLLTTIWGSTDEHTQGLAAMAGALGGFAATVLLGRLAGDRTHGAGLMLIVAGALVSMLLLALGNALLLLNPAQRQELLSWLLGNINPVYAPRLAQLWWLGLLSLLLVRVLARPLTLILLGNDKASSIGVNVRLCSWLALTAVAVGCGTAVAICGPLGFIGLVVPHMVRPFTGVSLAHMLPAAALLGALLCLLADWCAQHLFLPHVLNTGLLLDLLGGLTFVVLVRYFYVQPQRGSPP